MNPELTQDLDLPPVEADDIDQEAALLRLQGKKPKRSFIAKRLAHREAIFGEVPMGATPLWDQDPIPDPKVTETLIDWAFTQSEAVAAATFDFLDYPTDEGLEELLVFLGNEGIQVFELSVPKERSLTQMVLDTLQAHPTSIDELNRLARQFYPSARPEAAVRQVIRRLSRSGRLSIADNTIALN